MYNRATNYLVDVSAGWTFFTPVCAAIEHFAAGMEPKEILKSRAAGILAHGIAMRPTGMVRNALAKKWNVTKESPLYQKIAVNACALTPIQAVLYTGMLAYAGVPPGSNEYIAAMSTVLPTTLALSEPFGRWMDKWRTMWGKKPAIK